MDCNHHCDHINMKKLCISKVPIFNHLTKEEMKQILQLSIRKQFQKGEIIYHSEDHGEQLYIIHKGKVKIYRLAESGKEQLLRILEPGDFMGELSLFANIPLSSFAEAIEDTEICLINRHDLHKFIQKHPTIALKILEQFSLRLNHLETSLQSLSSTVEERIITYFNQLIKERTTDSQSKTIKLTLPMSKKDFASFIGTTQETLSRNLTALQNRNLIKQSGQRNITIMNIKEFNNLLLP